MTCTEAAGLRGGVFDGAVRHAALLTAAFAVPLSPPLFQTEDFRT
jgi:hypothetical protein